MTDGNAPLGPATVNLGVHWLGGNPYMLTRPAEDVDRRPPLARVVRPWGRLLWGVVFSTGQADNEPMLIGGQWAADLGGDPYAGEPTRALLFCTRQQARAWCAETMRKWRDGRQRDDIVARWKVQPVRVRETVQIDAPTFELRQATKAQET